jgi:hypothetical protein
MAFQNQNFQKKKKEINKRISYLFKEKKKIVNKENT